MLLLLVMFAVDRVPPPSKETFDLKKEQASTTCFGSRIDREFQSSMCEGPLIEAVPLLEPRPESGGVSCVSTGVWKSLLAVLATVSVFEHSRSARKASVFEALIRPGFVSACCAW
jgi:hypothetical protein